MAMVETAKIPFALEEVLTQAVYQYTISLSPATAVWKWKKNSFWNWISVQLGLRLVHWQTLNFHAFSNYRRMQHCLRRNRLCKQPLNHLLPSPSEAWSFLQESRIFSGFWFPSSKTGKSLHLFFIRFIHLKSFCKLDNLSIFLEPVFVDFLSLRRASSVAPTLESISQTLELGEKFFIKLKNSSFGSFCYNWWC